jgi:acyl-coenzyme A synthetase/AMP-(fatty) acid ligase
MANGGTGEAILAPTQPKEWPLIDPFEPDRAAYWTGDGPVSQADLYRRAGRLAGRLPDRPVAINYCTARDDFTVALLAMWMRNQTALFPADAGGHTFAALAADYPDLYTVSDAPLPFDPPSAVLLDRDDGAASADGPAVALPWTHAAAKVFTSGSTGKPSVNEKTWGMLVAGGKTIPRMLTLDELSSPAVVATVPSQHMYGFETTIMNALQGGAGVHAEHPVYPADIARCLADIPEPRVLVTTPIHLRALVGSAVALPPVERIISATAPLSPALAQEAETRLGAAVWEIYGFTEAGSVAARRTTQADVWRLREDFTVAEDGGRQFVDWWDFGRRVPFPDMIEVVDTRCIRLLGRSQDLVNIAGKRASLAGLTAQLLEVDGIEDGVVWLPSEDDGSGTVARLVAFVVAPDRRGEDLLRAVRDRLGAAFAPRRLVFVDALPRNATGKLTQAAIRDLAARHGIGDAAR